MKKKAPLKKRLVQIDMQPRAYKQLEKIQKMAALSTISEVIRFSIAIFKWTLEKQKDGYEIYAIPSKDKKGGDGEKIQMLLPL